MAFPFFFNKNRNLDPPYLQVTFLHVSHHLLMALYMWPSMRFLPGGHVSLGGVLNAFVHVVMYSYYLAAAAGGRAHRWARRY